MLFVSFYIFQASKQTFFYKALLKRHGDEVLYKTM